ncbi:hypothetical protein D1AOALGA4SA_2596 [Olavius algarvensis Delta 1 endosymbiont]|nr:hypothetical protein D1AOALGA4SA_2596 [Olavius algarvensis Delta 1 endosymbiont]
MTCEGVYQIPNTKHQTRDEFDFLRIHQYSTTKTITTAVSLRITVNLFYLRNAEADEFSVMRR